MGTLIISKLFLIAFILFERSQKSKELFLKLFLINSFYFCRSILRVLKQVSFFLFLFVSPVLLLAQRPDSFFNKKDTLSFKDSSFIKKQDSLTVIVDSIVKKDTVANTSALYNGALQKVLKENYLLNYRGKPTAMANRVKSRTLQDHYFFLLAAIMLMLGCLRFFYTRYFNNLFRVFFNASLRQSQLTDQLLQAKLPSLLFNILFVFTGGTYAYLVLRYFNWINSQHFWIVLFYCTLSLIIIYFVKFVTLKFTGWVTGYYEVTDTYIFVIFLINKILSVLLLPFGVIIAFSLPGLATVAVMISLLLLCLMFLLRFFRSYGLLQHQLKISKFHFFLYVLGIEVVPVLLIYKALVLLLSKNL